MGKAKQKIKDSDFMNWLDRKRSNKKLRQQAAKDIAELVRSDVKEILAKYSKVRDNTPAGAASL